MSTELISTQLFSDVCGIIDRGRENAYAAVNNSIIETYWNIGRRIVEEEQQGKERAGYGEHIIEKLSEQLTMRYGKGFSKRYLAYFRLFYLTISDIRILQTRLQNLTWSHIHRVLRVDDPVAIRWYLETASQEMWSVRTLDRNISTQYYERHYSQQSIKLIFLQKNNCGQRLNVRRNSFACSMKIRKTKHRNNKTAICPLYIKTKPNAHYGVKLT